MNWKPRDPGSVDCLAAGSTPELVIAHLGIQQEKIFRVLETARGDGVDTLLSPSPPEPLISNMYAHLTHLILNQTETAMLSDRCVEELNTVAAWGNAAQYFIHRGVENVVITLGDRGAFYATHTGQTGLVDAEKGVNVVDVTGAG